MEILESPSLAVLQAVLNLVWEGIVYDSQSNKFQQSLSLVGFIPSVVKFGGRA